MQIYGEWHNTRLVGLLDNNVYAYAHFPATVGTLGAEICLRVNSLMKVGPVYQDKSPINQNKKPCIVYFSS